MVLSRIIMLGLQKSPWRRRICLLMGAASADSNNASNAAQRHAYCTKKARGRTCSRRSNDSSTWIPEGAPVPDALKSTVFPTAAP